MEQITLQACHVQGGRVTYQFEVSAGLKRFFSERPLVIEYQFDISEVPQAVLAVPFVCCVLPLIWIADAALCLPELDEAFYHCIPEVRRGYEEMYPETKFTGEICVDKIVPCDRPGCGKSATFFSGGLDAVNTLIGHLDEKPDLVSIWGTDFAFENVEGWEIAHRGIQEYADKYQLASTTIRSTFREFDREYELDKAFSEQLKVNWWYGVKHGIALLGHAAPYAYVNGIETVYIASSNCTEDIGVRCASDPKTDSRVRYAEAKVVHDGFEFSRQGKVRNLVEYCRKTGDKTTVHVCYHTQTGRNCCLCEKCYRTIAGLLAENADPEEFGFIEYRQTLPDMKGFLYSGNIGSNVTDDWGWIHKRVIENRKELENKPYSEHIAWLIDADFTRPETWKMPLNYRVRQHLSQYKFYQKLHEWKSKLRK